MYGIILHYRTGRLIEVVILSLTADVMRVAVRGCSDAVELRRVDAEWTDEAGEAIAVGFLAVNENSEAHLPARRAG